MCGICGAIELRGAPGPPVDDETIRAMTETMHHRGPDDDGYHIGDGVAIGVRRLSIVDVEGGHQPIANERGTVIAAQNGELYNQQDVREELEAAGFVFRTTCDTEILPHVYTLVGDAAPERLNGIFAFVIWDVERRRALLARDRLGVKPLYFAEVDGLFLFGSELKAILASGLVPTDIDVEAVDLFLTLGFVPGPGRCFGTSESSFQATASSSRRRTCGSSGTGGIRIRRRSRTAPTRSGGRRSSTSSTTPCVAS